MVELDIMDRPIDKSEHSQVTIKKHWLWQSADTMPKDRKVLLRRKDSVYFGHFLYIRNGSIYCMIDANGQARRVDYWAVLPRYLVDIPK